MPLYGVARGVQCLSKVSSGMSAGLHLSAGISHPSLTSIRGTNLGLHLRHLGAPLHTHGVRSSVWQRPLSSLLTHITTRQASLQLQLCSIWQRPQRGWSSSM
jgi:hypothetical protein